MFSRQLFSLASANRGIHYFYVYSFTSCSLTFVYCLLELFVLDISLNNSFCNVDVFLGVQNVPYLSSGTHGPSRGWGM